MNDYSLDFDRICEAYAKMQEQIAFQEAIDKKQIQNAVLICNRENKYKLKAMIPDLCVYGTDLCDNKVYMVTDKTLAENIRSAIID